MWTKIRRNAGGWLARIEPPRRLPDVVVGGPVLLALRWLALAVAILLASFDRGEEGVLVAPWTAALLVAVYNGALSLAGLWIAWLRRPLNFLAIDMLVATAAVYLTGGYHSAFFTLLVGGVIGAALYLDLGPTILTVIGTGLIFAVTCAASPAGIGTPAALSALAAKTMVLQVLGVVMGLLLEGLRREHQETEVERLQNARIATLNHLLQQVTASLDLDHTLQTLADAARELLGADESVVLLREPESAELAAAAASGADLDCFRGRRISVAEPDLETVLTNAIVRSVDATASHPLAAWLALSGDRIHALASAPLRLEESLLGLLVIGRQSSTGFEDQDLPLLQALAQEAALAIRNARLFERERDQAERLRAIEQMQRGFILTIAHELRTPLTCIHTSVDLLQAQPPPAVQQELTHTIDHHTHRLEGLVSELLESTRLEVGQIELTRQPTDLRLMVERTVQAMAPMIQQRSQQLEIEVPAEPAMAFVDRRRIEQVLANLVTNAHKFTPRGGHIRVALARGDGELVVSVADDGPGIAPECQPFLFQRFYTVPGGTAKTGLGLGLFLTRSLIELHGGRAWLQSEPGQGSTFFVSLPELRKEDT